MIILVVILDVRRDTLVDWVMIPVETRLSCNLSGIPRKSSL